MNWASQRRLEILLIIGGVILVAFGFFLYSNFHKAPSCRDGKQNQNEAGVDCGGPCAYLCEAQTSAPIVRFTKALTPNPGRTVAIAYIDNPNANAAAQNAPYLLTLYGSDHTLITTQTGTVDLPPGKTVPVFLPNISTNKAVAAQAFLTFDNALIHWYTARDNRIVPSVSNPNLIGTTDNPRVTAMLSNPSTRALNDVKAVATVFDGEGNVVGASQTILKVIPPQGSSVATFTWNGAFPSTPARIEVIPIIPLVSR